MVAPPVGLADPVKLLKPYYMLMSMSTKKGMQQRAYMIPLRAPAGAPNSVVAIRATNAVIVN